MTGAWRLSRVSTRAHGVQPPGFPDTRRAVRDVTNLAIDKSVPRLKFLFCSCVSGASLAPLPIHRSQQDRPGRHPRGPVRPARIDARRCPRPDFEGVALRRRSGFAARRIRHAAFDRDPGANGPRARFARAPHANGPGSRGRRREASFVSALRSPQAFPSSAARARGPTGHHLFRRRRGAPDFPVARAAAIEGRHGRWTRGVRRSRAPASGPQVRPRRSAASGPAPRAGAGQTREIAAPEIPVSHAPRPRARLAREAGRGGRSRSASL